MKFNHFTALIISIALTSFLLPLLAQEPAVVTKPTEVQKVEPAPAPAVKKEEPVKTPKKAKKPEYFTLNFKDVDITEFLNMMSQMIGRNIILDDNVHGKITISSAKKIPVTEAYNVMKSILEVKGLAVVETDNLLKVLPIRDAIKQNAEIIVDGNKKIELNEQKTMTFLLEIMYADASQISQVLQPLKSQFTDIVVYPALNTIIFSGSSSEIDGLTKIARALDRSPDSDTDPNAVKAVKGNINIIPLRYTNAEELAGVLSRVPFSEVAFIDNEENSQPVRQSAAAQRAAANAGQQPQQANQPKSKLSIIASKEANALIITANPEEFRAISNLVAQLDVVREQVFIEALIAEVSADNSWGFGIDWMLGGQSGQNLFGGSQIMGGSNLTYSSPEGLNKTAVLPMNVGFQLGYLNDGSLLSFALLNASASDSNFNVLSTPQILTIDNEEAELNVGEQIPIPTQSSTGTSGVTQYSYDYKSVGVKLKITPHITADGNITLDLYQEVNSVIGSTTTLGSTIIPPKLGKRDIKTNITVQNGKTVVVGGLITNTKSITETKVPILGDIPLLGYLFKQHNESYKKTNLLVFITPHLVTKSEKLDAITEQKKDEQKLLGE